MLIGPEERPEIPLVQAGPDGRLRILGVFIRLLVLVGRILAGHLLGRSDPRRTGRLIGDFCQRTGVLWIKVGQLLSMRSDILPPEMCAVLARLQERAEGFSPKLAREIIAEELGAPISEVFSRFDDRPWAAASIAQVHRARLRKSGREVAIKVRRPGIEEIFDRDMALVRFLFRTLDRFSVMAHLRWDDMLWELGQVFTEELDYRYEVANQKRIRTTLKDHGIYVPEVFDQYSTRHVIVMEFIEAVSMADYLQVLGSDPERLAQWLDRNGIDPREVSRTLLHSYLRQLVEDNLFHADLHPGNIFLLRNSRVALLDFGSTGTNERDLLRKYDAFLETLSLSQYAKAVDIFLLIMPDLPASNLATIKDELQRSLHAWGDRCRVRELPYKEKSASRIFDEMTRIMARHGVDIVWSFFKILRGWGTLDTSLRELHPEANLLQLTREYTLARRQREVAKALLEAPGDLLRLQKLIDYPREISETAIYRGAMVRRLAQVFEGTTTRVSRLAAMFFGLGSAVNFVAVILALILMLEQRTGIIGLAEIRPLDRLSGELPRLDLQVWCLILAFFGYGWLTLAGLARRFKRQD